MHKTENCHHAFDSGFPFPMLSHGVSSFQLVPPEILVHWHGIFALKILIDLKFVKNLHEN